MSDSARLYRGSLSPDEAVSKLGALVTQIDEIETMALADATGRALGTGCSAFHSAVVTGAPPTEPGGVLPLVFAVQEPIAPGKRARANERHLSPAKNDRHFNENLRKHTFEHFPGENHIIVAADFFPMFTSIRRHHCVSHSIFLRTS